MKKLLAATAAALTFALVIGCQPTVVTTPVTPPNREKETDIRIRTPGVDVDVKGKGDGKGVDVERKKKGPDR
jgi:hypothetical protein